MSRSLRALAVSGAILATTAASAQAASLSMSASPAVIPQAGGSVTVTETGQADRAGSLLVHYQRAAYPCEATSENERNSGHATALNDRQNLGPGEAFTETGTFTAQAGVSYRVCGYLGDFDDTRPPDARADLLICAAGYHVAANQCVADDSAGGGGSGKTKLKIKAPGRAGGTFKVTLSWTARSSDRSIQLYAQPAKIACYKTGEDERNHGYRGIKTIFDRQFNQAESGSKTFKVKEAKGGRTRLCAYLYDAFNDTGKPRKAKKAVVN